MSDDDRALIGRKTPARGVEFSNEPVTGVYEGEELARIRARRPTDERIGRLEDKHDKLVGTVTEARLDIAEMRAEVRTLIKHVESALTESHRTERVRIGSRAKVIVAVVGAIGALAGVLGTLLAGCM
jgi:hypothetical protein